MKPPRPVPTAADAAWRAMRRVAFGAGLLAAVLLAALVLALLHLKRDTLLAQTRAMASLASANADELDRGLQGVMLVLRGLRDDLREQRLPPDADDATAMLHRRTETLTLVRQLWVLDAKGRVIASSSPAGEPPRSFMPALDELGDEAAAISEPYTDLALHDTVVAVALRWRGPRSNAAGVTGWVVAGLPASGLLGAFPAAGHAPDARLAVFRADGRLLAGTLDDGASALPDALSDDALQRWADGSERLVQRRRIDGSGLALVMTRDLHAGLARWRGLVTDSALAAALVLALVAALLARLLRAERARWRTQRVLDEGRDRAALAFAAAQEGNWDWDPAAERFFLSPRMKELLGLPRDGPAAGHAFDAVTRHVAPAGAAALRAALAGARVDLLLAVNPDAGGERIVRLRGTAASGRVAGVASDVSDEQRRAEHTRALEQRLARSQRLDALGTLAGGVAHDFNNILAALAGYAEMARGAAPEGSAQARHLDQVLAAAERGRGTVGRILNLGRGGGLRAAAVFAVQPIVAQVLDLLAGSAGERVPMRRDWAAAPLHVRGDADALFEAVMNLATNALQAMPDGGTLAVTIDVRVAAAGQLTSHGMLSAGEHVAITVADSGRGIAPEHLERLFEPYFTTRGHAGTGLGLAVVHGVAAAFGGGVDVESTPGHGSRFTLWLPRVDEAPAAPAAPDAIDAAPPLDGRGRRVMVVDDEPALVMLAEEWLAGLGFEPVGFTDPKQALARLQAEPSGFDLLLCDELMPGMNGTELARRAKALNAALPVVLASGWGGPQLAERAREAGVSEVLAKPLSTAELQAALQRSMRA